MTMGMVDMRGDFANTRCTIPQPEIRRNGGRLSALNQLALRSGAPLHTAVNLIPGLSGLPERLRGKRLIMASAFEVYVDDSGSEPQGEIFFLAGFISSVERWAAFSNEWDSALALHPSLDYFKMSEAAGFWEQFSSSRGWNEAAREDRLVTFARIINKYAMLRVSVSTRHDLFEKYVVSLPATERNFATDEPYVMLVFHLVSVALQFAYERGIREPIDFIFDHQSAKKEVFSGWERYKSILQFTQRGRQLSPLFGDPFFLDEKDRRPLQAADLYVWQARNHYMENHRFKNQKIVVPMNSILRLFRGIPPLHGAMTEAVLLRQYNSLVRTGERLKREQPSLKLIAAEFDRKLRRKARKQTRRKRRNKA